ncbi:PKD domain-containing protein [Nocardioides sp. Soil777]|uniref:PKD domain-containing protein n=1 Tax=Nocardioides sp. Soil777 TaxID=1736409 RepID=UPI000AABA31C|nr:PKD domain-containing protein [Nocardioides sp. Soil777]
MHTHHHAHHPLGARRSRGRSAGAVLASGLLLAAGAAVPAPAVAVNADHGQQVVSDDPVNVTPHVMNGSVDAVTQIGNKVIAAGTFTSVSPSSTFTNTGDDLVRNRIFAFDATTGAIDTAFNPNLGGAVNSLDTDGTHVYVGGSFGSVGGNSAIRRVVKLTAGGAVVGSFNAVPDGGVNEVVVRGSRLYVGGSFSGIRSGTTTTPRSRLAVLDASTGAVSSSLDVPFTGVYDPANGGGGGTVIKRFDVSADGSRLVAVGNFATVGGQPRVQIAMLDTSGPSATVASWATNRFDRAHNNCAAVFDTFMRDVDFAPDGSWFAVNTTGAFAGGASSGTLCDTTTRWETSSSGNDPTWANYSGGDTLYGVAVTGSAVYVGGHQRWSNNSFQGDQAGPGAVPREGIAALDPVNGLPLSWNPGRARGVGAQALHATPQGLWVGSDTNSLGGERHARIAFMPLAGGTTVPAVEAARLPNDLFLAERTTGAGAGVLFRSNAGGPALQSGDGGPEWSTDNGVVSGGSAAGWGAAVPVDSTVPDGTPPEVFVTERYGAQDWNFPVAPGRAVEVRLYFANQYDGTGTVGARVFDVLIDGVTRLSRFDIVAAAGDNRGTMRSFPITADADGIDVDLRAITENPLINAIEIVDPAAADPTATEGALLRRSVDATGAPTGAATPVNTAIDWSRLRGGFLVDGTLYYGLPDGGFYRRSFDPSTGAVGSQQTVNLYDDPDTGERIPFAIANLTGTFYDPGTHRIYYTVFNDDRLFYRYFTPESRVVGAQTFVADSGGVGLGAVAGMTLAGDRVLYGSSADGALRSVPFADGRVTGGPTTLSTDGTWRYRTIVAGEGTVAVNQPPTAAAAGSCTVLTCGFTGSGSDPEGGPLQLAWDFGDGTSGSGAAPTHTYDAPGDYEVTLTVTDDAGATATSTVVVGAVRANGDPVAAFTSGCDGLACTFDASGSQDPDGDDLQYAWSFGDGDTGAGSTPSHTYGAAGAYDVTLTVTDPLGATDATTRSVEVETGATQPGEITPVGASSVNRNALTFPVTVPATTEQGDAMLLFLTENRSETVVTGPGPGWSRLGAPVVDGTSRTTAWSRVAQDGDAGDQVSVSVDLRTKAATTLLVYRGAHPDNPVGAWAGAAKQGTSATHQTPVVANVDDGAWRISYWAVKSSTVTTLTGPAQEVVRDSTTGEGSGRVLTLVTDGGGAGSAGSQGGLEARTDDTTGMASTWTVMLRPAPNG